MKINFNKYFSIIPVIGLCLNSVSHSSDSAEKNEEEWVSYSGFPNWRQLEKDRWEEADKSYAPSAPEETTKERSVFYDCYDWRPVMYDQGKKTDNRFSISFDPNVVYYRPFDAENLTLREKCFRHQTAAGFKYIFSGSGSFLYYLLSFIDPLLPDSSNLASVKENAYLVYDPQEKTIRLIYQSRTEDKPIPYEFLPELPGQFDAFMPSYPEE